MLPAQSLQNDLALLTDARISLDGEASLVTEQRDAQGFGAAREELSARQAAVDAERKTAGLLRKHVQSAADRGADDVEFWGLVEERDAAQQRLRDELSRLEEAAG